jgi:hypothetical protein
MPSESKCCIICGKGGRKARSEFTQILTKELANKIKAGSRRRYKQHINGCLIGEYIHKTCYKSLANNMKPLSMMNLTGRPKLWRRASTKALNSDRSLSSSNRILSDRSNNQIITSTSNHCSFFATINDDVSVDEQIVSFQQINGMDDNVENYSLDIDKEVKLYFLLWLFHKDW